VTERQLGGEVVQEVNADLAWTRSVPRLLDRVEQRQHPCGLLGEPRVTITQLRLYRTYLELLFASIDRSEPMT